MVVLAAIGLAAAPAAAQIRSPANVSAGYSALREVGASDAVYGVGWAVSFATTPPGGFGWAAEGGENYRRPAGVTQRLLAVLGGARFTLPTTGRLVPFVQGLAGLERYSEPGFSENGFAAQPGGGVDIFMTRAAAIRAQVDYRWVRTDQRTFNEVRFVAGVTWAFRK
jgi:hypothetical protein